MQRERVTVWLRVKDVGHRSLEGSIRSFRGALNKLHCAVASVRE